MRQTRGDCIVRGKVSALLELGSGFNPEFTGRENVIMNGAILGFDTREMHRRLEAIARFAEIGSFLDQPVKIYSSGMFMRLAFAVAVNVDPDILLVDEALAVGDLIFQHRCMHRMNELRQSGRPSSSLPMTSAPSRGFAIGPSCSTRETAGGFDPGQGRAEVQGSRVRA